VNLLNDFRNNRNNRMLCDTLPGFVVDYTYNFDGSRVSLLDHFLNSTSLVSLANSSVVSVSVQHDIDNLSDHERICLEINIQCDYFNLPSSETCSKHTLY